MISDFLISDIDCHVYINGKPNIIFYWGTAKDHTDMEKVIALLNEAGAQNYFLCTYEANDWNSDFSPWEVPPVFGKEDFCGKGKYTLEFLKNKLIPHIEITYPETTNAKRVIAGYSLAGLFCLWASCKEDFDGAISCSGSLWFPGWLDFLASVSLPNEDCKFYLSLGDKESKTKNEIMAKVAENTLKTVEFLRNTGHCQFEWNQGGHFNNSEERMAKAFLYFLIK